MVRLSLRLKPLLTGLGDLEYSEFLMKMKSKKAAAKRFKFTATGKVKFKRTKKRHNLGNKSSAKKLGLRGPGYMMDGDVRHVLRCLPYGTK